MASSRCEEHKTLFAGPFSLDDESKIRDQMAIAFACFRVRADEILEWRVYTLRESRLGGHESIVIGLPQRGLVTIELSFEHVTHPFDEQTNEKKLSIDSMFFRPGNDDITTKLNFFGTVNTTSEVIIQNAINEISTMPAYVYGVATCQDFVDSFLVGIGLERRPTQVTPLEVATGLDYRRHIVDRDFICKHLTRFIVGLSWIGYMAACLLIFIDFSIDYDVFKVTIIRVVAWILFNGFVVVNLFYLLADSISPNHEIEPLPFFDHVILQEICVGALEISHRYLSKSTLIILAGIIFICEVVILMCTDYLFSLKIILLIYPLYFFSFPRGRTLIMFQCFALLMFVICTILNLNVIYSFEEKK